MEKVIVNEQDLVIILKKLENPDGEKPNYGLVFEYYNENGRPEEVKLIKLRSFHLCRLTKMLDHEMFVKEFRDK